MAITGGKVVHRKTFLRAQADTSNKKAAIGAYQSIDTSSDFTLRWNSLGGSSLDIVQLLVLDTFSNIVLAKQFPTRQNSGSARRQSSHHNGTRSKNT